MGTNVETILLHNWSLNSFIANKLLNISYLEDDDRVKEESKRLYDRLLALGLFFYGNYFLILGKKNLCEIFIKNHLTTHTDFFLPLHHFMLLNSREKKFDNEYKFIKILHESPAKIKITSSLLENEKYYSLKDKYDKDILYYVFSGRASDQNDYNFIYLPSDILSSHESTYFKACLLYAAGVIVIDDYLPYNIKDEIAKYSEVSTIVNIKIDTGKPVWEKTEFNIKNISTTNWKEEEKAYKFGSFKKTSLLKVQHQKTVISDFLLHETKRCIGLNTSNNEIANNDLQTYHLIMLLESYLVEMIHLFNAVYSDLFKVAKKVIKNDKFCQSVRDKFKNIPLDKMDDDEISNSLTQLIEIIILTNGKTIWEEFNIILYKCIRDRLSKNFGKPFTMI